MLLGQPGRATLRSRPRWRSAWPISGGRFSGIDLEGEIERKMAKNEAPPKPHAKAF